jgi:hypothetical protein
MAKGEKTSEYVVPSTPPILPMNPSDLLAMDHISTAHFEGPSSVYLRFADGFEGTWTFAQLEWDTFDLFPETIRASESGTAIQIGTRTGKVVELDSSSLRTLTDPDYAERLESEIAPLMIPSDRLERMASRNQPPQEWYD